MKQSTLKIALTSALTGLVLAFMPGNALAQTIEAFGLPPTPGLNDISQFSTNGNQTAPDGLNYYNDNGANFAAAAGQTFTTLANAAGYVLTSVAFKSGDASTGGGGAGIQAGGYIVEIYSIANGTNATVMSSNVLGAGTFQYLPGNWLQVSGLAIPLNANTTYAYSFSRTTAGWDNMDVASGNPYAGGEIALIPIAGGSIAPLDVHHGEGPTHAFDAQFNIGLALQGAAPVVGIPSATPNPCYALSPVVLTVGATPATYQWQTNSDISGGLGGTWVNIPGATSLTITNIPPDGAGYTLDYQLIATSGALSTTSAPVALQVNPASAPTVTVDTTPAGPVSIYVAATLTLNASYVGTTPITNQWQTDAGQTGTYTNIPGQTTGTLTITNVQVFNAGHYRLQASNLKGSATSTPVLVAIYPIIYAETFSVPTSADQPITNVGWMNDISGANNRLFSGNGGLTFPRCAVYSYNGTAGSVESFYATTASANGGPFGPGGSVSNKLVMPSIDLSIVQNLSFSIDMNANGAGTYNAWLQVQIDHGQWYVSNIGLTPQVNSQTFVTDTVIFDPTAANWNLMTNSGTGNYFGNYTNTQPYPAIGPVATANLSGHITGVGIVFQHVTGGDVQFDNFYVLGTIPPTTLPVISSPPSSKTNYTGTTARFDVSANTNGSSAGLTYQWQANTAVGSGTWANLSNAGQFSGVTSAELAIASVSTAANHKDYRVIVTDGAGSTTSAPPATLTVIDSAPILTSDTVIYPNASPAFGATSFIIHAGNNNIMNIAASFVGNLPMNFQWQVSPNPDGSGAVNVPGATSSTLSLSDPQPTASGYYSLKVSNSQSVAPTNSAWAQLTVSNASAALIQWSAPVVINGLTASQILNGPPGGTFVAAESFGATAIVTVTNNGTVYVFDNTGVAAIMSGNVRIITGVYLGPSTGDANLDAVLGVDTEASGTPTITLNGLTPGVLYSAQLFSINDTAGALRQISLADATDPTDVSSAFLMGDNVYLTGTFLAASGTVVINQNEADSHGYISAVIIRQAKPTLTENTSGSNKQIVWNFGTLLESTNVAGPFTTQTPGTTTGPSSYTVVPTGAAKFYRVSFP